MFAKETLRRMNAVNDNADPPGRMSALFAGLIVLLIFATPAVGFWWLRAMSRATAEQSALAHARDMLIVHFARTSGQWPRSWDDLAGDFEPADAGYGTPSFDVLKDRISIDFDVDLPSLIAGPPNPSEPPRVFWLRRRPDAPEVDDANARLIDALRSRHTVHERHRDASTP